VPTRNFYFRPTTAFLLAAAASIIGCGDRGLGPDGPSDLTAPSLIVTAPHRATLSTGGGWIRVEGVATDRESGLHRVEVNGIPATVSADGSFMATVPLTAGTLLLHTVAFDADGNRATDTRSVLSGSFVALDTPVDRAFAAAVSADGFASIADVAESKINQTDLGAAVQSLNPVFEKGFTCLRAALEIADIDTSAVRIQLVPHAGGLRLEAEIDNLDVPMDIPFELACANGDATARLRASRFSIAADLDVGIRSGQFTVEIGAGQAWFEGFLLDVAFVPGDVLNLIYDDIDNVVANVLVGQVESIVGPKLRDALNGLAAGKAIELLGSTIVVQISPEAISFADAGAHVSLNASMEARRVPDSGLGYLSTPEALPELTPATTPGLSVAMADDAGNQLLSGLWASGALDQTLPLGGGEYGEVGVLFDAVHLSALLPPVLRATDQGLSVVLGDLLCAFEKDGLASTTVIINASADLAVTSHPDGTLSLTLGDPVVHADFEAAIGANALADQEVETLAAFVGTRALTVLGSMVGHVPVPAIGGVALEDLAIDLGQTHPGYLVLGGRLSDAP